MARCAVYKQPVLGFVEPIVAPTKPKPKPKSKFGSFKDKEEEEEEKLISAAILYTKRKYKVVKGIKALFNLLFK